MDPRLVLKHHHRLQKRSLRRLPLRFTRLPGLCLFLKVLAPFSLPLATRTLFPMVRFDWRLRRFMVNQ